MTDAAARKERGAFFTPPAIADLLAQWALRTPDDRLLEPACGEAVFLVSAIERLKDMGVSQPQASQLAGVDVHPESVSLARELVAETGATADLRTEDFFSKPAAAEYDAVIGNPPYIRYQAFTGEVRARAKAAALSQGVRCDGLSSSWAPFTVHAAAFLRSGGRLGLVLPAELLSVNYAAPVRTFLLRRFSRVRLVLFEKRIFHDVLEEIVLVLAEGDGPTDHFEVIQAKDVENLLELKPTTWFPPNGAGVKWTSALLDLETAGAYARLATSVAFSELAYWGDTDLGMVTGNNKYFTLSARQAHELRLPESELMRISPPGSRHLRGLSFSEEAWEELARLDRSVYLFDPARFPISPGAQDYIERGEALGVHGAYKCRVRKPWWRVPKVATPDLFLTYMNHDTPRLVANKAGAAYLNSIHGVFLRPSYRQLGVDFLPIAALNSVTLLAAELVGRSYGGGMLKVEPREADRVPVPSPETVQRCAKELHALRPRLIRHLENNQLHEAVRLVDQALLVRDQQVSSVDLESLRAGREALFNRRAARSKVHP